MNYYWDSLQDRDMVASHLKQGDVVLASGDTVLGLFADVTQAGYDKLNQTKQRTGKPYLIVIPSADHLSKFVHVPESDTVQQLIETCWPGPVTMLFKAREGLPTYMQGDGGMIALRVPAHAQLQELLKSFNGLFSTSANLHGQPIPERLDQVDQSIMEQVGAVCTQRGVDQYGQLPSTIIDCSSDIIKVLRKGADFENKLKKLDVLQLD